MRAKLEKILKFKKALGKIKIGLDWGYSSLKLIILELQNDTYILKDAKIIPLPSSDLKLSEIIKDLNLPCGVNLGISGPNVVIRYVALPKMNEKEFKDSLRYEAATHLPFPVEELNLDGLILKDLPDNKMLVMLAAAKKDFINQRLKLLQEAGIRVNILDIDSLALINAFNYVRSQESISLAAEVLVNIGAMVTSLNILENGIPHFSRDIGVAGDNFAAKTPKESAVADLAAEIRKSFDYYEAQSTATIEKIFLSGGGSMVAGLENSLKEFLDIETETWDPLAKFEFAPNLDREDLKTKFASFAVAVGLALR